MFFSDFCFLLKVSSVWSITVWICFSFFPNWRAWQRLSDATSRVTIDPACQFSIGCVQILTAKWNNMLAIVHAAWHLISTLIKPFNYMKTICLMLVVLKYHCYYYSFFSFQVKSQLCWYNSSVNHSLKYTVVYF